MTLKLILIRHVKSDWGAPGLRDHDRALNGRGQRDAPRIGAWLAANGHVPEAAKVSSALRTRMTWAAVAEALPEPVPEQVVPQLYEASPGTILDAIRSADDPSIAVIGHNPGIGETMHHILAKAPDHPRFSDIPTGATLVAEFDADDWVQVGWGTGKVLDFITPHDL